MHFFLHFNQHIDLIIEIIVDAAFLIGLVFIFKALIKLKIYGEMRSMMTPYARVNQIVLLLFTGCLLAYFPQVAKPLLVDAFFGTPIIKELPYHATHIQDLSGVVYLAAKRLIHLLGHISLIRGIVQLGSYQEGGRHSLGKSLTHMIAGVCGINIQGTLDLLNNLVGVDLMQIL